jgi:hypothetical protein
MPVSRLPQCSLLCLSLCLPALAAAAELQLSADVALDLGNAATPDHGYLLDEGAGVVGAVVLPQLPASADLDALEIRADDSVLFSLDQTAVIGALTAAPGDAVSCRFATCQIAFDASAAGLPTGIDLDAIASRNGRLLLSFAAAFDHAQLGLVLPQDVVEFDGSQLASVVFDGSAEGLPAAVDVDAVHANADGSLLLSFDRSVLIAGLVLFDHDVVRFTPATHQFSLERALADAHAAWSRADLDAIAGARVGDRLFHDSFD